MDSEERLKNKPLTAKQKAFVAEHLSNGQNGTLAAAKAYKVVKPNTAAVIASENLRKPNIKEAIRKALITQDASPESAVENIKRIADATEVNPSASLNANKLILQLHGWKENDRPTSILQINNRFFAEKRKEENIIDI